MKDVEKLVWNYNPVRGEKGCEHPITIKAAAEHQEAQQRFDEQSPLKTTLEKLNVALGKSIIEVSVANVDKDKLSAPKRPAMHTVLR